MCKQQPSSACWPTCSWSCAGYVTGLTATAKALAGFAEQTALLGARSVPRFCATPCCLQVRAARAKNSAAAIAASVAAEGYDSDEEVYATAKALQAEEGDGEDDIAAKVGYALPPGDTWRYSARLSRAVSASDAVQNASVPAQCFTCKSCVLCASQLRLPATRWLPLWLLSMHLAPCGNKGSPGCCMRQLD
jgi:hypothetical protein